MNSIINKMNKAFWVALILAVPFAVVAQECNLQLSESWSGTDLSYSSNIGIETVTFNSPDTAGTFSTDFRGDGTFNTIDFWSNPDVAGSTGLEYIINWDDTPDADEDATVDTETKLVTIDFGKPVQNAIIHIDRLGGFYSHVLMGNALPYISNSTLWELQNANASMVKLSGNDQFEVTASTFFRTPNIDLGVPTPTFEATLDGLGTAAGSVQIIGVYQVLTFEVSGLGPDGQNFSNSSNGASDGIEMIFEASYEPIAGFEVLNNPNCDGLFIDVENTSTGDDLMYAWYTDWPDGDVASTEENPSLIFDNTGVYTIALIASDGVCQDTMIADGIVVSAPGDIGVGYEISTVGCTEASTVTLTCTSSAVSQAIESTSWVVEAGGETFTSDEESFSFMVSDASEITITKTVVGTTGCDATLEETVTLDVEPFELSFDEVTGCADDVIVIAEGLDENIEFSFNPNVGSFEDGILSVSGVSETTTVSYTADLNGCPASGDFTVNIVADPLGDDASYTICGAESVIVGTQFATYDYTFDPEGVIEVVGGELVATGTGENVSVTITATSLQGCSFEQVVSFMEMGEDPLNLPDEVTLCAGDDLVIADIPDGVEVTGTPEGNVEIVDGTLVITNVTETTVVTITTTEGTCVSSNDITVNLGTSPMNDLPDNITLCPGESIEINDGGDPNCTYTWIVDGSVIIDDADSSSPTIGLPGTGSGVGTGSGTAYTGSGTVTYIIECPDSDCPVMGTIVVDGNQPPAYDNIPTDIVLCSYENSFSIEGYDENTYTWMTDGCLLVDDPNSNNPTFTWLLGTGSGTCEIGFTVSNENCSVDGVIQVHKQADPFEDLVTEYTICAGSELALNPNADENCTYTWMSDPENESLLTQLDSPNPIVIVNENTTFFVTAVCATGSGTTGSGTCEYTAVIDVMVDEGPELTCGGDIVVCEIGEEVTLSCDLDSTVVNAVWKDGDVIIGEGSEITITDYEDGQCFTLCASNALGCESTAEFCIEVGGGEATIESSTGLVYCTGEEVTLISDIVGDWTENDVNIATDTDMVTVIPPGGDVEYCITGITAEGCEVTECITLTEEILEVFVDGNTAICFGEATTLTAVASGGEDYTYEWSTGEVTESIDVSEAGTYCVTVTSAEGCTAEACADVTEGGPTNCTATAESTTVVAGECTTLTASAEGEGLTYLWSPGGEMTQSIEVCPEETTTYTVIITDENGCECEAEVTVNVSDNCCDVDQLWIPNTFSPNNDGTNDVWEITGQDGFCISEYKVIVYDRWGEQVFMSMDFGQGWDGTYEGVSLNPDVYGYHLTFICDNNGEEVTEIGNITLLK